MTTGFGKAKYGPGGGNGSYYKNFSVTTPKNHGETTDNIYRVLPPVKSLIESGKWAFFHPVHFGYRGLDRSDPSKTKVRTFRCVEEKNFKTQLITAECAECEAIKAKEQLVKDRIEQGKASGKSAEQIDLLVAPLKAWLKDHNCDRKWYLNVMNDKGEFGVLKLGTKAKKQMEIKINELLSDPDDPIDPLDVDQGVWFNIKRSGKNFNDIQDTVEIVMDRQGKVMTYKNAALSADQVKAALEILPDLTTVATYLARDQVGALVTGSGDAEEVDAIFNQGRKETSAVPIRTTSVVVKPAQVTVPTPAPTPTPAAVVAEAPAAPAAPAVNPDIAALMAQIAALQAQAAATPPVELPKAAPPPPPAAVNSASLPDEDFLKHFPAPTRTTA